MAEDRNNPNEQRNAGTNTGNEGGQNAPGRNASYASLDAAHASLSAYCLAHAARHTLRFGKRA